MTILQYADESNPFEIIDKVVTQWERIAVPLFIKDQHSAHKVLGCGSGFVVDRHGASFLVTAHHVLHGLEDGEPLAANIAGTGVLLNGRPFAMSPEDDLVVMLIDSTWAKEQELAKVYSISLDPPDRSRTMLEQFILLGYPGAKNKLNSNANETTRHVVGYSSSQRIEHPKSTTHIRNPIAFGFDKKSAVNSSRERVDVGRFNGNSGGPVLEISGRLIDGDVLNLSVHVAGVFIGWDKHHKELICCRPDAITDLIDGLA
jgi:hypothetical protein